MTSIGSASLQVIPSFDGFGRNLDRGTSGPLAAAGVSGGRKFGDAAGRSAGARFGSVFKTAAKASLIGLAGAGALAVKFGSDAVGSASDLNESLNAVNVTYGKQAKGVKKLGRESAKALGLSNSEFNGLAVRYSAFAKTIGGDKKTVRVLDDLTTRASDFASVMNLEVAESAQLFQSGLAGESEPLRKYGIDLSAASVEAFAFANGIAEAGAKLTEQQKVQARYGSIMEQTAKTQGDFKNTSGELANQQRILSARFEDTKAKLGKELLPILSEAADFLLDEGIPAFERFSDWFGEKGIPKLKRFGGFVRDDVIPVVQDLGGYAETAAGFVGDMVSGFKDMPDWAQKALVGGGAAAFAANKILPSGGKGAGGLLGLVTKAKPLPVFVVNQMPGGLPGTGTKTPPVVPGGIPKPKVTLPKWAPFIPIGLGSSPGQDSLMSELFGFGLKGDKSLEREFNPAPIADFNEYVGQAIEKHRRLNGLIGESNDKLETTKGKVKTLDSFFQRKHAVRVDTSAAQAQLDRLVAAMSAIGGLPGLGPIGAVAGAAGMFSGPITVNANSPKEFEEWANKKRRAGAGGGR